MVDTQANTRSRKRLGRGLASLMSQPVAVRTPTTSVAPATPAASPPAAAPPQSPPKAPADARLREIAVGAIRPNPYQPRKQIDPARLQALAASIRQSGVMQPVLVRSRSGGGYELIAGERRWRAAQLTDLQALPAIICDLDDAATAEWALVENLQREDLDPIERAEAFQSLVSEFALTHSQIAERVGLDRSSVANTIRLNALDDETKSDVRQGRLSQGHAKVLLSLTDPALRRTIARSAVRNEWTVRRLEREVGAALATQSGAAQPQRPTRKSADVTQLEERLSKALRLPARIHQGRSRTSGQIIFTFRTLEEFESFLARAEK